MKIETHKGIDIYELKDIKGGNYYEARGLTTKKAPTNFAPTIRLLKSFIDEERLKQYYI